jgi:N-acetylmuramoyl-L-alanine amidase
VGHSDVAPARKTDPGELFPWALLAGAGLGIFPGPAPSAGCAKDAHGRESAGFAEMLAQFGYGVSPAVDIPLATVVTAFQRHFRPENVDGVVDAETELRLGSLLQMIPEIGRA